MDLRGFRGWSAKYYDGAEIFEGQSEWKDIPKKGIKCLTLHYDGRRWDLNDKLVYFQKKKASVVPGIPDSFRIESRTIGYYEDSNKIMYTVDENTGRMNMEVKGVS